jgi:peptidoglycan/LPS O-acetylase OafA/YrhL
MNANDTTMPALCETPSITGRHGTDRFHHLDALRGFALLLGVVFHAAQSFGPHNNYWAILDSSPSTFLERCCFGSHSFRMALFFLIAGFFARLLLSRRGTAGFVLNRLQRILVPLVVGWVILYPLVVYLWLWGASVAGELGKAGVPPPFQHLPLWKLVLGFFVSGSFLRKLDLTHLWFLHQLLVIYMVLVIIRWVWSLIHGADAFAARCDRWFERLCHWPAVVLVFALLCVPMLLTMRGWIVDTPSSSLLPYPPTTLFYGFCFLVGWLLHRQPGLVDASYRIYLVHLPLVIALQITVAHLPLPWPVKFPLLVAVALGVLLLSYHYLVRSSWIGLLLNGHRYPRHWPWGHNLGKRQTSTGDPHNVPVHGTPLVLKPARMAPLSDARVNAQ